MLGHKKDIDKAMEKNIREFFGKVNEGVALTFLNPLYRSKTYIKSGLFEEKVRAAVKDFLKGLFEIKKK